MYSQKHEAKLDVLDVFHERSLTTSVLLLVSEVALSCWVAGALLLPPDSEMISPQSRTKPPTSIPRPATMLTPQQPRTSALPTICKPAPTPERKGEAL